jgi:hypothetical protein
MFTFRRSDPARAIMMTGAAAVLAGAVLGAPVAAQVNPDRPNAGDVAMTPLDDLGITSKDIPEVLLRAVLDPYTMEHMHTCNSMTAEIMRLDGVLGEDYDAYAEGQGGFDVGRAAQSLVGSIIPFRGVVREVTGAAGKDRDMAAAITAGMVRRGFLKGVGMERGCDVPARPKDRPEPDPDSEGEATNAKAGAD